MMYTEVIKLTNAFAQNVIQKKIKFLLRRIKGIVVAAIIIKSIRSAWKIFRKMEKLAYVINVKEDLH